MTALPVASANGHKPPDAAQLRPLVLVEPLALVHQAGSLHGSSVGRLKMRPNVRSPNGVRFQEKQSSLPSPKNTVRTSFRSIRRLSTQAVLLPHDGTGSPLGAQPIRLRISFLVSEGTSPSTSTPIGRACSSSSSITSISPFADPLVPRECCQPRAAQPSPGHPRRPDREPRQQLGA